MKLHMYDMLLSHYKVPVRDAIMAKRVIIKMALRKRKEKKILPFLEHILYVFEIRRP